MKTSVKLLAITAIVAVIGFSMAGCDKDDNDNNNNNEEETATVPQPSQKTLSFGSVTISSPDEHLPSAWNALCDDVVSALETAYVNGNGPSQSRFGTVFGNTLDLYGRGNGEIVLINNLANNWEVRDGEFNTLYLKTGSIATANYDTAVRRMMTNVPEVGKATPEKDRVFLG